MKIARKQKKRIQEESGAEDGSTDSLVTNVALDNMNVNADMARKELTKIAIGKALFIIYSLLL